MQISPSVSMSSKRLNLLQTVEYYVKDLTPISKRNQVLGRSVYDRCNSICWTLYWFHQRSRKSTNHKYWLTRREAAKRANKKLQERIKRYVEIHFGGAPLPANSLALQRQKVNIDHQTQVDSGADILPINQVCVRVWFLKSSTRLGWTLRQQQIILSHRSS